mgnify:CR=1 FL=1
MSAQSNPIVIDNFQRGIATSPYVGFGKMVGLDIFKKPGIIQCGARLVNTGATFTGIVTAQAIASNGTLFQGTSDGKVYRNGTVIASGRGVIHDMVIIQDFLIISLNGTVLDLYGNISTGGVYTTSWKTGLEASVFGTKKMIVGKDNVVYIGNETKLASLRDFTPGTGTATATLTTQILLTGIFNNKVVQTLSEYNRFVAIMTSPGSGNYGNSTLYFMDRGTLDPSKTTFTIGIGVDIPEKNVNQMIIKDNRLYFFGNDTGTFYETNQVTWTPIAVLPNRLLSQTYTTYPNAICLLNNQIVLGIGGSVNPAWDVVYGVYGLQGNSLICKSIISSGGYGQTNNISIGSVISGASVDGYYASWQDGSTYGVDSATTYIGTSFNVYFESRFFETGSAIKPRTFQTIQFNLANNLVTGQSIKVKYRIASNDTWTTFATYSYSGTTLTMTYTDGSLTTTQTGNFNTFHSRFPVTNTTNIQLRVEFDTGANATYGTNIELQSIILI